MLPLPNMEIFVKRGLDPVLMACIATFTLCFFPTKKSRTHIMIVPVKKTCSGKVISEHVELLFFALRRWGSRQNLVSVSYDFLPCTSYYIKYLGARLGCFQ